MRIVIVDDESHVVWALRMYLAQEGFDVEIAGNAIEALRQIRDRPPDAVVTDIQMPLADGRDLCESIQDALPNRTFPIFVVSSLPERDQREWLSKIPRCEFIPKPLSPRVLLAKLNEALPKKRSYAI